MSTEKDKLEISPETKLYIIDKLVEPYYKDMVKATIDGKQCWRTLGIGLETSSKIMIALGGIFSFSAGYYHDDTLSFVAGSISCMSLALLQIASFSYKENKKQGDLSELEAYKKGAVSHKKQIAKKMSVNKYMTSKGHKGRNLY